ncbi:Protein quaking [Strongyloides ratti]|uniref:Protein quaking n=1 Tax=Strongyloides ratti TaxID=34506 RepID=A0A090L6E6_STRRB|nr:Protein quaking [Strongyloides ratti]CEF63079.1 Protein quaking [Strongyloides ratti]
MQNSTTCRFNLTDIRKIISDNNLNSHEKKLNTSITSQSSRSTSSKEDEEQNRLMEHLIGLLKEKKQLMVFSGVFPLLEQLVDEEISRVRMRLFQCNFSNTKIDLPEPEGNLQFVQEKIYVPYKEYPDFNFVGRILGPRGMTAKQLELETECKIMVRGKGSMRDKKKEEAMRGKVNWEHLDDDLHVLIQCEDTKNRALIKIKNAIAQVKKLLVPAPEGSDELKRKQLMELAVINGTYRNGLTGHKGSSSSSPVVPPLNVISPFQNHYNRSVNNSLYLGNQGSNNTSFNSMNCDMSGKGMPFMNPQNEEITKNMEALFKSLQLLNGREYNFQMNPLFQNANLLSNALNDINMQHLFQQNVYNQECTPLSSSEHSDNGNFNIEYENMTRNVFNRLGGGDN